MRFAPLFRFRVRHGYYPGDLCPDFAVTPDSDTLRLLGNHRGRFLAKPDGGQILLAADAQRRPLIPVPDAAVFRFQLRLRNPDFALFTSVPILSGGSPVVFRRRGPRPTSGPVVLSAESPLVDHRQRWEWPGGAGELRLALPLPPAPSALPADFRVEGVSLASAPVFRAGDRLLVLRATPVATPREIQVTYPVIPRRAAGVTAHAEIRREDLPADPDANLEVDVVFTAKAVRWKYYLVTQGANGGTGYAIESTGLPAFAAAPADPNDDLRATLAREYPAADGFTISSFLSSELIPCRTAPTGQLSLKKGAEVVLSPLPTPLLQNLCAVGGDPALFHFLKRLTNA